MSFWSENKETFKSAGIATAKGIGSGTKALSKAGYKSLKNQDSSRAPGPNSDRPDLTHVSGASTPLMDKEQLLSLPPPPRRNAPASGVSSRSGVSLASTTGGLRNFTGTSQPQNQQAGNSQPLHNPALQTQQTLELAPPQYPSQQQPEQQHQQPPVPLPARTGTIPVAINGDQATQQHVEANVPQAVPHRDYCQRAPMAPPGQPSGAEQNTNRPLTLPAQQQSQETAYDSIQGPNLQERKPATSKSIPDATMFAPPPVRVERNMSAQPVVPQVGSSISNLPVSVGAPPPALPARTGSSAGSTPASSANNSSAGQAELTPAPPSYTETASNCAPPAGAAKTTNTGTKPTRIPVRYVEIDASKFGPPPPRRVDASSRTTSRNEPAAPTSRGPVPPPPPPRTSSASSTASIPAPSPKPEEALGKPKKTPPPKPAKLKQDGKVPSGSQKPLENIESGNVSVSPVKKPDFLPTTPNFAAEIANLKLKKVSTNKPEGGKNEEVSSSISNPPTRSGSMVTHDSLPETDNASEDDQNKAQEKPQKPAKPPKPGKPSKFVVKTSNAVSQPDDDTSNDTGKRPPRKPSVVLKPQNSPAGPSDAKPENIAGSPQISSPKPLVLPFKVEHRPHSTGFPASRVPLKGQHLDQSHESATSVSDSATRFNLVDGASAHSSVAGLKSKFERPNEEANNEQPKKPSPLVVPFSVEPPHTHHLPGFRVPVRGQHDSTSEKPVNESRLSVPSPPPSRNSRGNMNAPSVSSTPPPPPPPARNYVRPAEPLPTKPPMHPSVDLNLSSGWYANTSGPLDLPADIAGLNYSTSLQTSLKTVSGETIQESSRSIDVRFKDLSKMVMKISWTNNDFKSATLEVVEFIPSPIEYNRPSKKQLEESSAKFGDYITAWCFRKEGQKVGSGECWDLARDALAKGCGKHAFVSQYYHHGYPILVLNGGSSGPTVSRGPEDEVKPGDILQFKLATIHNKSTGVTQTVGSPDHTAVVYEKVEGTLRVLEQNVQGMKVVKKGEYILSNLVDGSVTVYRPVPAEWAQ